MKKILRIVLVMLSLGAVSQIVTPPEAQARAGRSRSVGRSSAPPPQSANPQRSYDQPPATPFNAPNAATPPRSGGFMRNMAGGIAGGFLGSMLFSSLGHGGVGGTGGGGIGLFELLLFAGIAYFGFRWWRNRQSPHQNAAAGDSGWMRQGSESGPFAPGNRAAAFRASMSAQIPNEEASDIFFKVQGAWTRRDLTPVQSLMTATMADLLATDAAELRKEGRINRLENIAVRRIEVLRSWDESGTEFSVVRFTANLLDYTVDEKTQAVVDGSDSDPVKFEEDWTFERQGSGPWQLAGIQQVAG